MSEAFDAVEIISAKRDRNELSDLQIDWIVDAYTRGVVADEQVSALLMAILLNGMNMREISRWTDAMINSGERMNWSSLAVPTVDAGLVVHRGSEADALFTRNETSNRWEIGLDGSAQHAITRKFVSQVGDGVVLNWPITHNLGTREVAVQVYDSVSYDTVEADVVRTSDNVVTVSFASPPPAQAFKVVIIG